MTLQKLLVLQANLALQENLARQKTTRTTLKLQSRKALLESLARMEKQLSDEELKVLADCVIENDGDIELLRKQVEAIYNSLLK